MIKKLIKKPINAIIKFGKVCFLRILFLKKYKPEYADSEFSKLVLINLLFQKIFRINSDVSWSVHYTSRVTCPYNIKFGKNVWKNFVRSGNCFIQGVNGIIIGDNTIWAPGVGIISANHDLDNMEIHKKEGPIKIGDNCWIGMNAMILPGVELGNNVVVGAGSIVTKNFPDNVMIAGNPAKIIKHLEKKMNNARYKLDPFHPEEYIKLKQSHMKIKLIKKLDIKTYNTVKKDVMGVLEYPTAKLLFDIATDNSHKGDIVEIGSYFGLSTIILALGLRISNNGKIYAIDPHTGGIGLYRTHGNKKMEDYSSFKKFIDNIKRYDLKKYIRPIKKKSEEAIKEFNKKVRLLWIDGWHSYEAVKIDIEKWFPLLKKGCPIVIHDYNWKEVKKAVDDFLPKEQIELPLKKIGCGVWTVKK